MENKVDISAKDLNEVDIATVVEVLKSEIKNNEAENIKLQEKILKKEQGINVDEENIKKQEELNIKIKDYKLYQVFPRQLSRPQKQTYYYLRQ